jgi:hypothetical protein
MTIHQAYLLFPKLTYEWISFCRDLPKILIEDERLFNLFLKYPFLMDNENEIYIDFSEELYKELINWAYISEKNQITQEKLYSLIYKIANDSFKEIIAKYIPLEMNLFIIRPDIFYSIDSIQNYESLLEINDENEIENITNQQLSKAETDFVNFQFPQNTFFKDLREWRIRSLRLPKIKIVQTPPIVKVLTQFDSANSTYPKGGLSSSHEY